MLNLSTEGYAKLETDDILIKQNRKLFAVDSFELIYNNFDKENEIFFIMGSDNFNKMSCWKDYEKIKDMYKYIVIERDENEISSTQIRDMIKTKDIRAINYIPENVYNYILENNLYKL